MARKLRAYLDAENHAALKGWLFPPAPAAPLIESARKLIGHRRRRATERTSMLPLGIVADRPQEDEASRHLPTFIEKRATRVS